MRIVSANQRDRQAFSPVGGCKQEQTAEEIMVVHRRRTQQSRPLKERLAEFADRLRRKAREIPIGPEKDEIKKKLRQVSVAAEWASSAELRPPSDHRRPRRP